MVPRMLSAFPQSSYSITVENISLFSLSASFNPKSFCAAPCPPACLANKLGGLYGTSVPCVIRGPPAAVPWPSAAPTR